MNFSDLNRQQLIEKAANYSRVPFMAGKPVVDECRKHFEANNFGTTNDFYNEVLPLAFPPKRNR